MKKGIALLLAIFMIVGLFSGCNATKDENEKISIVTTIFPEYDWVKNIVGDTKNVDITMLLDTGVDLHSFQPTADDIITISNCDLFVYVGGESDGWVKDALKEAVNKDMIVIDLLDVLGSSVKEEEIVEGMEAEEEDEEEDEDEPEYDEHVWLSLKNAKTLVSKISNAVIKIDSENEEKYKANTNSYLEKLDTLDKSYKETIDNSAKKTILFADRFPFRYLVDDYGLSYFAAFVGCSAESEASFETVMFLANKVNELKLNSVLVLEGNDKKIANTVISTSKAENVQILSIDSMQATKGEDVKKGVSYLSIMEKNLEVLSKALK